MPSGGDVDALGAQLVDDLVDRAEHRAERDDDRLGVLARVRAEQPARAASERLLELAGDPRDDVERLHLLRVHEVLDLGERLGADHRADRHRVVGVEHLARLEGGQERVDLLLLGRSTGSTACVSTKPSMHTITGSESSSASANAWTWRSTASWFDSAKSWIQPQSRWDITSSGRSRC